MMMMIFEEWLDQDVRLKAREQRDDRSSRIQVCVCDPRYFLEVCPLIKLFLDSEDETVTKKLKTSPPKTVSTQRAPSKKSETTPKRTASTQKTQSKKSETTPKRAASTQKTQAKKSETTPKSTVSTRSPSKKNIRTPQSLKNPTSAPLRRSPRKTCSPSTSKKQKTTLLDFFGNIPIKRTYRLEVDSGSKSGQNELASKNKEEKKTVELDVVPEPHHDMEEAVGMEFNEVAKAVTMLEEDKATASGKVRAEGCCLIIPRCGHVLRVCCLLSGVAGTRGPRLCEDTPGRRLLPWARPK